MKFVRLIFCAAAVSLLLISSTVASAENRAGAVTLSPYLGGCLFEGDQHLKTSMVYGGALGYDITDNWGMELSSAFIDSGTRHGDSVDVDTYFYHLDALYHFTNMGKFQPFLAAGVGGMTFNYRNSGDGDDDPSHTAFAFNYGGGFEYFIVENFALRGDLRHIITTDGGHNDLMGTIGITVLLGGRQAPAPEPVAVIPPPTPEPAPAPAPAPKVVTPPPAQNNVCIELKVLFDFDKSDIKPEYHDDIQRVADFLKANPTFKGAIVGNTDAVGSEEYNIGLSQRRADSVKTYIIDNFGIAADRLKAVGEGKDKPITTNLTEEGRQLNRRAVRVYCSLEGDLPEPPLQQYCVGMKVEFDSGSAVIKPQYDSEIRRVADYMNEHPTEIGTVEGYADGKGSEDYNMKLSQKRADAVKKYLVEKYNIPEHRIKTKALGKTRPIADNSTPEGRAANRYAVEMFCSPEPN